MCQCQKMSTGRKGRKSVTLAALGALVLGSRMSITSSSVHNTMFFSNQSQAQVRLYPEASWIPPEGPSSANTAMRCPAVLLLLVGGVGAFRICAFNAQRLTLAKVAREQVMDTLVQVSLSLQGSCTPEDHKTKPPALPDPEHVPEKKGRGYRDIGQGPSVVLA